jgi:hypothetical protein
MPIPTKARALGKSGAFSSEVEPGSGEDPKGQVKEYAKKQETRAPFPFHRIGKGSRAAFAAPLNRCDDVFSGPAASARHQ